ncbi:hypothetical protein AAULR_04801 [Lacticaseibacillus rhamnosus MTCC 5462]|nr:hypothetical protein AAULR_04801 [Lacticaseibacillus rhamnosus MTCC 5462]
MNTFIFDIDGTLLDNVEGYLYGLQNFTPPWPQNRH